jgi:broad specificity phosphatase PhoE
MLLLLQMHATLLLTWTVIVIHLERVVVVDALLTGDIGVTIPKSTKQRTYFFKMMSKSDDEDDNFHHHQHKKNKQTKRIVWIRHGKTYMNELIGGGGTSYGQSGFTDVFEDDKIHLYRDSPLSPTGIQQAYELKETLHQRYNSPTTDFKLLQELDLVVVSPLTRALQTLELALYQHIIQDQQQHRQQQCKKFPIVALPLATERVYLISDHGKSRTVLQQQYPFVDFDTYFLKDDDDDQTPWYFVPTKEQVQTYVEWRPHGQGQVYSCLGEPQDVFDLRMSQLYHWLQSREEQCIAVICHAGVIEWMTSGEIIANCEVRIQQFHDLRPRNLLQSWGVK